MIVFSIFFDLFGFFSISIGFQLDFFGNLIFSIFLRFFRFFWIFFDFNWISIGFVWISIGFQLDFFMSVGEATSLIEKKIKNQIHFFYFFDFNWFNSKSNRIEISEQNKKNEEIKKNCFFITFKSLLII